MITMDNRFRVEVIKKKLTPEEDKACSFIIDSLKEKTKLTNIDEQLFVCNLSDNDAVVATVHFANQLKKYPQYFKSIRCFDIVSGTEKHFIK